MAIVQYTVRASNVISMPGHGARETWFFQQSTNSLDAAYQTWKDTVEPRRLLLGAEAELTAIELSMEYDNTGAKVLGDSVISYTYKQGYQSEGLAAPTVCLLIKAQNDVRTRRRNAYLRGIWDSVELTGGKYIVPQGSTWATKLGNWKEAMNGAKVGYVENVRGPKVSIATVTQTNDGTVLIVASGNVFTAPQVDARLPVRIYTARQGSQLAGVQVVVPSSLTTCETIDRIAVLPGSLTGWTISTYTPNWVRTPNLDEQKTADHKIGRPLLVSRGRAKARARV